MINRKSNFIESRINKNEHTCKILLERVNRLTHVQRTIKRQENIEEKGLNTSKENMQAPTHAKNMSNVTDDILRRNTLTMDKSKLLIQNIKCHNFRCKCTNSRETHSINEQAISRLFINVDSV